METDSIAILAGLQPLHPPEAVPLWPPAPGWYAVGVLLLALLAWGAARWARHIRSQRYRKAAIKLLRQLAAEGPPASARETLLAINSLLKRVALQTFPREKVAPLSGQEWLEFLARAGRSTDFTRAPGSLLAEGLYGNQESEISKEQLGELISLAEKWIKGHRKHAAMD